MAFKNRISTIFRVVLILVLIAGMYGIVPAEANAKTQRTTVSEWNDCSPNEGWVWTRGPAKPEVASQVQQELSGRGIGAMIEARSYGETDSCGTYYEQGIDFSIHLVDQGSKQWSSQQALVDHILPTVRKHGKPDLGNVKLFSPHGELIPTNTQESFSAAPASCT